MPRARRPKHSKEPNRTFLSTGRAERARGGAGARRKPARGTHRRCPRCPAGPSQRHGPEDPHQEADAAAWVRLLGLPPRQRALTREFFGVAAGPGQYIRRAYTPCHRRRLKPPARARMLLVMPSTPSRSLRRCGPRAQKLMAHPTPAFHDKHDRISLGAMYLCEAWSHTGASGSVRSIASMLIAVELKAQCWRLKRPHSTAAMASFDVDARLDSALGSSRGAKRPGKSSG